jgi:hypothetical protein
MKHSKKSKTKRTSGARAQESQAAKPLETSEYLDGYRDGYREAWAEQRARARAALGRLAGELGVLEDLRPRA